MLLASWAIPISAADTSALNTETTTAAVTRTPRRVAREAKPPCFTLALRCTVLRHALTVDASNVASQGQGHLRCRFDVYLFIVGKITQVPNAEGSVRNSGVHLRNGDVRGNCFILVLKLVRERSGTYHSLTCSCERGLRRGGLMGTFYGDLRRIVWMLARGRWSQQSEVRRLRRAFLFLLGLKTKGVGREFA